MHITDAFAYLKVTGLFCPLWGCWPLINLLSVKCSNLSYPLRVVRNWFFGPFFQACPACLFVHDCCLLLFVYRSLSWVIEACLTSYFIGLIHHHFTVRIFCYVTFHFAWISHRLIFCQRCSSNAHFFLDKPFSKRLFGDYCSKTFTLWLTCCLFLLYSECSRKHFLWMLPYYLFVAEFCVV